MKNEEIKTLNIYEKLSKITAEMGVVEKGLKVQVNKTASYNAVSERDILDTIKPLEEKYRVYSYPIKREVIDRDTLTKESEYNGSITKTNTLFMRLETTYRFVNLDKIDEFVDIITYGDGLDTGDKAPGKAMTYADKYALMKAYKISTGDDPDKEASPEKGYTKKDSYAKEILATEKQKEMIKNILTDEELEKTKEKYGNDLEKLDIQMASKIISSKKGNN
jgi:hypothetical protein